MRFFLFQGIIEGFAKGTVLTDAGVFGVVKYHEERCSVFLFLYHPANISPEVALYNLLIDGQGSFSKSISSHVRANASLIRSPV